MNKEMISESAEQALLMCIIRAPRIFEELKFLVKKHHFTLIKSQKLFEIIQEWININKDEITNIGYDEFISYLEIQYGEWLEKNKTFLSEASAKIIDTEQACEKWKHYYRILEKYYFFASFTELIEKSKREAEENPLDIKTHIQSLQNNINKVYTGMNLLESDSSLSTVIDSFRGEYIKRLDPDYKPAHFGISSFDEIHGGFYPNTYHLITARSSVGKSALSLCGAKHMLTKQNKRVAFFNLETKNFPFLIRWFAPELKINSRQLRDPKLLTVDQRREFYKLQEALLEKYQNRLHLIDDLYNTNQIIDKLFSINAAHGLDVVIIDLIEYVKMSGHFENRQRELANISDEFFQLRKKLDIAIIMIQQQNKEGDKQGGQSAGRGAEDPYMQSDTSIGLYKYETDEGHIDPDRRTIIINKNRDGETGTITVKFNKEFTLFEDDVIGGVLD